MKINHIFYFFSFIPFCLFADIMQSAGRKCLNFRNESAPFDLRLITPVILATLGFGYPHVENPASLGIDPTGAIIVAEAHRFKYGGQI